MKYFLSCILFFALLFCYGCSLKSTDDTEDRAIKEGMSQAQVTNELGNEFGMQFLVKLNGSEYTYLEYYGKKKHGHLQILFKDRKLVAISNEDLKRSVRNVNECIEFIQSNNILDKFSALEWRSEGDGGMVNSSITKITVDMPKDRVAEILGIPDKTTTLSTSKNNSLNNDVWWYVNVNHFSVAAYAIEFEESRVKCILYNYGVKTALQSENTLAEHYMRTKQLYQID